MDTSTHMPLSVDHQLALFDFVVMPTSQCPHTHGHTDTETQTHTHTWRERERGRQAEAKRERERNAFTQSTHKQTYARADTHAKQSK
jgi:hypothetical protein